MADPTSIPSTVTAEVRAALCLAIADGMTVRQFCAQPGMPAPSSIYLALANDPTFADQYARAREAQMVRWEDELVEIADDGSNDRTTRKGRDGEAFEVVDHDHISRSKLRVDTRKWIMAKRAPKKYGERVDLQHSGGEGPPIRTELTPSRELAVGIARLLAKAGKADAGN